MRIGIHIYFVRFVLPLVFVGQQPALGPVDDISLEIDGRVRIPLRARKLLEPSQGKYVVAHDEVFRVVDVERAELGMVDDVVLDQDRSRSLVGVDAPTSVTVRVHVVHEVVADYGTG